ncbi:MAG: MerR family transcriptional regulator [Bryobacteraceae bacterium]|nr:MerR family transcriptional regulator [Bryobacteraceae bacterium]
MAQGIQIGEVVKATGLSHDAIRFYEKQKLLGRPNRSEGGFRLYSDRDIEQLKFIQQAQAQGFSLAEIRELLELQGDVTACAQVRHRLQQKIGEVQEKIRQLRQIETRLAAGLRKCSRALAASRVTDEEPCPVFPELTPRRDLRARKPRAN